MRRLVLALSLSAGLFLACGNATRSEVKSVPDRFEPLPEGQALVVLARPDDADWGSAFVVVDGQGKFVADVPASSRVHVVMPAGRHTFVGWESKVMHDYLWASRVELELQAGLAYSVSIENLANGLQLIAKPETPSNEPCAATEDALSARRIESERLSVEEYLVDDKIRKQLATSNEWLEDLGSPRARQVVSPPDGIPVASLEAGYRRAHAATFCVPSKPAP